jgi:hypothetical protein
MRFDKDITTYDTQEGKKLWGDKTLPSGAKVVGTIKMKGKRDALLQLVTGTFARGYNGEWKLLGEIHEESRTPR